MFRNASLFVAWMVCCAVGGGAVLAEEGRDREAEGERRQAVGRYQLYAHSGQLFMLDTATGRCWSRDGRGAWVYEGNPTRHPGADRARGRENDRRDRPKEVTLDLESESVELVIHQRESRDISGSRGTMRIRIGDITDGQALLSVSDTDGKRLLNRTSVSQGDEAEFTVDDRLFTVRVKELRNLLTGDDFATLLISEGGTDRDDRGDEASDD